MFDMLSLLWGVVISGACLSAMVLVHWTTNRGSGFLLTWAASVLVLIAHVVAFWFYAQTASPTLGTLASALLPVGAVGLFVAARQFAKGESPTTRGMWLAMPYLVVVPPAFALGHDVPALVAQNVFAAVFFAMTGWIYVSHRREAPLALAALGALYAAMAVSFGLCAVALLMVGEWRLGTAPRNWAEDINVVVSIIAMSGIGALTLALDQSRRAVRSHADAMTDAMTGLGNRRGMLAAHAGPFGPRKAIVIFDIDHFKAINDHHGHAVGDDVIRRFAEILRANRRERDHMVRLGGEEFVAILDDVAPDQVRRIAERICAAFAASPLRDDRGGTFNATISAGIAFGDATGPHLDEVLMSADGALYQAKRAGRNRIEIGEWRLVG
jgi:diguanylate cyclase (GGDEF)-like protein